MAEVTILRGAVLGQGYRLGRPLGDGGSSVYQATHEKLFGHYVVRLFREEALAQPEATSRIQRGVRLASLLRDQRTVQVLDFSVSGESPAFAVMEKVDGPSLASLMAEQGMLPLGRVVELVESIAAALESAHHLGLVHGDLRPAHIFVPRGAGQPPLKLAGLGWAKELRAAAKQPAPSGYLAPEQHFGKVVNLDARADQFALGALAYELLAGCLPFSEESADLADRQGARRTPPALAEMVPGVPATIDRVLRQALATEARERFAGVVEMARHLRASSGIGVPSALPLPPRVATPPVPVQVPAAPAPASAPPLPDPTEELEITEGALFAGNGRPHPGRPAAVADDILDEELDDQEATVTRIPAPARSFRSAPAVSAATVDDGKTQISRSPFLDEDQDATVDTMLEERSGGRASGGRSGRVGPPAGDGWSPRKSGSVVLSPPSSVSGRTITSSFTTAAAARGVRATWIYVSVAVIAVGIVGLAWLAHNRRPASPGAAPSAPVAAPPGQRAAAPAPGSPTTAPGAPAPPPAMPPAGSTAPPSTAAPAAVATPPPIPEPLPPRIEPLPPPDVPEVQVARRSSAAGARGHAQVKPRPNRGVAVRSAPTSSAPAAQSLPPTSATGAVPITRWQGDATPGGAAPAGAGSGECSVQLSSKPSAQVWIDGKNTGLKTPTGVYHLACGAHKLQLKRPDRGLEQMEMLRVEKGKLFRGNYELE